MMLRKTLPSTYEGELPFKIEYSDKFFSQGNFIVRNDDSNFVLNEELILKMELEDILLFQAALSGINK